MVKPPNAVEFGILSDPDLPARLSVAELASLYGVGLQQIKAWQAELRATGTIAKGKPLTRDRSETVRSIIDACLASILSTAEMSVETLSPRDRIRHMEACGSVLARVHPYLATESEPVVVDEHDAWVMIERASRSADVIIH